MIAHTVLEGPFTDFVNLFWWSTANNKQGLFGKKTTKKQKKSVFDNRIPFNSCVGDAFALMLLSPPTIQTGQIKAKQKHKGEGNSWTPRI